MANLEERSLEITGDSGATLEEIIPRVLKVLSKAFLQFCKIGIATDSSCFDSERPYQALKKDLCDYEDIWLTAILRIGSDRDSDCDLSIKIITALCTISRSRGDVEGCRNIMNTLCLRLVEQLLAMTANRQQQDSECIKEAFKFLDFRMRMGVLMIDR
jgi:hypothetical protein